MLFVCVAVYLEYEESQPGEHQPDVRRRPEALEAPGRTPEGEEAEHECQGSHLAQLNPYIES